MSDYTASATPGGAVPPGPTPPPGPVPPQYPTGGAPQSGVENLRIITLICYALFLAGFLSFHFTAIAGVILAYVKRGDAHGTVFASHLDNLIEVFWISLVVAVIAIPLCFVVIGIPILFGVAIWYLYRTIKGLARALDGKPYY